MKTKKCTKFNLIMLMMMVISLVTVMLPVNEGMIASAAKNPYKTATKLALKNGKTVKKTYKFAEDDWEKYTKIVVKKGSKVTITVKSYLKDNVEASIQKADHTELYSMITEPLQEGEKSSTVKYTELYSPGTYYIVLSHMASNLSTGKCLVQVKSTQLKDTEDGDHSTVFTAQQLKKSKTVYGVLSQETSQEFYKFTVKKGQKGTIKIKSAETITCGLRNVKDLLKEDREIKSSTINLGDLDAGTYYIAIQKVNSTSTTYTVKMTVK